MEQQEFLLRQELQVLNSKLKKVLMLSEKAQVIFSSQEKKLNLCFDEIRDLENALHDMFECKYEPDKILCLYEASLSLKRRQAIKERKRITT